MSKASDPEFQPIYCAWAEQRWNLTGVTRVEFELDEDVGYSEWTPGAGAYVSVTIWHSGGKTQHDELESLAVLLADILRVAARLGSTQGGERSNG